MSNRIPIDVLCFSDYRTDSITQAVRELNEVWGKSAIQFRERSSRPRLPTIRLGEWLTREDFEGILSKQKRSNVPLIAITKHRLGQDFFYYGFPQGGAAVFTTYCSPWVPSYVLETKFLEYSLVYSALDLLGSLSPLIWHAETRGCLFDDVPQPSEIELGLRLCQICPQCKKRIERTVSVNPKLKEVFSEVERVLDWLRPKDNFGETPPNRPKRKAPDGKQTLLGSKGESGSPPYVLLENYLRIDRKLVINEIRRRYKIELEPDFADHPSKIENALRAVTKFTLGSDRRSSMLRGIVRCNRATDGLNADVSDKRHRDHTLHQLYVAVLGFIFLDMRVVTVRVGKRFGSEVRSFRSIIADKLALSEPLVDVAWFLTAVLHDHAYPIANTLQRTKRILRAKARLGGWHYVADRLRIDILNIKKSKLMSASLFECIPEYLCSNRRWPKIADADRFEENYSNVLLTALSRIVDQSGLRKAMPRLRYDHGVIGAANLSLVSSCKPDFVAPVCKAIFEHNLQHTIVLEQEPLSFLLKLCDTLQEWDRIVYTADGEVVRESEALHLGPFEQKRGLLFLEEALSPRFDFGLEDLLNKTGWKQQLWVEGTTKHLALLQNEGKVFVKLDNISVKYAKSVT